VLHGKLEQLRKEEACGLYAFPEYGALIEKGIDPERFALLEFPRNCHRPSETVLRTHGQNLRFLLELPRTLANKRVQLFEAIL